MQHIFIMGSGAVGGFYGALLAQADGMNVTFIARGAHLEAMKKNGLVITGLMNKRLDDIRAESDPARIHHPPDLVLMTVKSFDTKQAIEQLRPVVASGTLILTIQNGLENYELLAEAFGSRVIRGFCKIGAEVTSPGVIDYRGLSHVFFGEENGEPSNRVIQIQKIMEYAGINATVSNKIRKEAWLKFIWNGIFNMLTGLSKSATNLVFEDGNAYKTAWQLFFEMQAVAGADGVIISDKEGGKIIDDTRNLGAFLTSTCQDRRKGKRLEFDAFCGYVVRKADAYKLGVPATRTLFALYRMLEKAGEA